MDRLRGLWVLGYFLGLMPVGAAWITVAARGREQAQAVMRGRGRRALRLGGLTADLDGEEHVPEGGCVLVYNESSWPDMFAFYALLWGRIIDRGAAAAELGRLPFMKSAGKRLGLSLLPRGDRAGVDRVLDELCEALRAGERVAFGGEGRMSGTDGVLRFKQGAALLAIRSGKPLVPVASHGGHLLMPWGGLRLRPGAVRLRIGTPIPSDGLGDEDARDLADRAQAAVAALYAELGQEEGERSA